MADADQAQQRVRGRPGEGTAVLHGGAGVREAARHPDGPVPLADRGVARGAGRAELLLEPNENPAAQVFQKALYDQGIPLTAFASADVRAEYARLKALGVVFRGEPMQMGTTTAGAFEDSCGNLIQLYEG
jgi:hypothetical protein